MVQRTASVSLSLYELILGFMEFAVERGKLSFPSLIITKVGPWHEFLYKLGRESAADFLELECVGDFDWDGPRPTARKWAGTAISLILIHVCETRMFGGRSYFRPEKKRDQNPLAITRPELLEKMFKVALETEGFFED